MFKMNKFRLLLLTLVMSGLLVTANSALAANPPLQRYFAHLEGDQEVPPRETPAWGYALFEFKPYHNELRFRVYVNQLTNPVASHIHLGKPDENGPVVAFLYGPKDPRGGPASGRLAMGAIKTGDLIGPLKDHPLSDLLDALNEGRAYVNVHTNDGVNPTNTGPGDFPGGEIRGQIMKIVPDM